jgi:hypothetical protein
MMTIPAAVGAFVCFYPLSPMSLRRKGLQPIALPQSQTRLKRRRIVTVTQ